MDVSKVKSAVQWLVKGMQSQAVSDADLQQLGYLGLLGDLQSFYRAYWNIPLDAVYDTAFAAMHEPADRLFAAAFDADARCLPNVALGIAEVAASLKPTPLNQSTFAGFLRKSGNIVRAREICRRIEQSSPNNQQALSELFMCEVAELFWPRDYYDLLAELHAVCRPRVYLEVGVATGKSLALLQQETRALGIDPASAELSSLLYHSPVNTPQLYKMTSDDFFASHDVRHEMGRSCFDLAFIDGLHHFDQVLRDFIHIEQFAEANSVVLIHDCLPVDPRVATRERATSFWTGDVWKIIPCLKSVRPDLDVVTLPLSPAGLAVVRGLDSNNRVLARHYREIVAQFERLDLPKLWDERCKLLAVEQSQSAFRLEQIVPSGGWS